MFAVMLAVGALGSFVIAARVMDMFPTKDNGALVCAHGTTNIRIEERLEQNRILLEVVCAPTPR